VNAAESRTNLLYFLQNVCQKCIFYTDTAMCKRTTEQSTTCCCFCLVGKKNLEFVPVCSDKIYLCAFLCCQEMVVSLWGIGSEGGGQTKKRKKGRNQSGSFALPASVSAYMILEREVQYCCTLKSASDLLPCRDIF
jgi:hypothetical protein